MNAKLNTIAEKVQFIQDHGLDLFTKAIRRKRQLEREKAEAEAKKNQDARKRKIEQWNSFVWNGGRL